MKGIFIFSLMIIIIHFFTHTQAKDVICETSECIYQESLNIYKNPHVEKIYLNYIGKGQFIEFSQRQKIYNQMVGTAASFIGDYVLASKTYTTPSIPKFFDKSKNNTYHAISAAPKIIKAARNNRIVIFNESHGDAKTRLVLFQSLKKLRKLGYTHLGFETFSVSSPVENTSSCSNNLEDNDLTKRGYVLRDSGFYTRESISALTVNMAIDLGFELFSYDMNGETNIERFEKSATAVACIINEDPLNKVIILGGFGNIAELKTADKDPQTLSDWITEKTDIDPVTISTNMLLAVDQDRYFPSQKTTPGKAYLISNDKKVIYSDSKYDYSVWVAGHPERKSGTWLTMLGYRKPVVIYLKNPDVRFLQIYRSDMRKDATPIDRCVIADNKCTLYIPKWKFKITGKNHELEIICKDKIDKQSLSAEICH